MKISIKQRIISLIIALLMVLTSLFSPVSVYAEDLSADEIQEEISADDETVGLAEDAESEETEPEITSAALLEEISEDTTAAGEEQLSDETQDPDAAEDNGFSENAQIVDTVRVDDGTAPETDESTDVTFKNIASESFGIDGAMHTIMKERSLIAEISLYSENTDDNISIQPAEAESALEGLEIEQAYAIVGKTDARLWVKAVPGAEFKAEDGCCYCVYGIKDGKTDKVIIEDISADSGAAAVDSDVTGFALVKDTGYRHKRIIMFAEGTATVALEGLMPTDAEPDAVDVTDKYDENAEDGGLKTFSDDADKTIAAYDITIKNGDTEYQPTTDRPIFVEIDDQRITDTANMQLWHIKDSGEREQITDFTAEEGKISFYAYGFSVYEIVEGPAPYVPLLEDITDTDLLTSGDHYQNGFLLYYGSGNSIKYIENTTNNNSAFIETSNITKAAVWYFEKVENTTDQFYIYTKKDGVDQYIINTSGNLIGLSTETKHKFKLESDGTKFCFKLDGANKWLQHSNGGGGIRLFTDNNNATNSRIGINYADLLIIPKDPYGLDGKSYGLMNVQSAPYGCSMQAETDTKTNKKLKSAQNMIMPNSFEENKVNYIAKEENITMWTFKSVREDIYTLSAKVNNTDKYLKLDSAGVYLSDEPCEIMVVPGMGEHEGKIKLVVDNNAILFNNTNYVFERAANNTDEKLWLSLADYSDLVTEDFAVYSAEKISVSAAQNNRDYILYTRVWNASTSRYDFYAVDYDGTLVQCYERGENIMWIGNKINTLLWHFTEYYWEGTDVSNGYYELQNNYSGKFIAPQISGQPLANKKIGINLPGRENVGYYSEIMAWDDPHYSYAGIKTENGNIVSCPRSESMDFYMASMTPVEDVLTPVETVDNNLYGITMKMVDFDNQAQQDNVLGGKASSQDRNAELGLLSTNISVPENADPDNCYPIPINHPEKNLGELFGGATVVNHLFLDSTHQATGYFEFDSCQNFATLIKNDGTRGTDFTVYKELGTSGKDDGCTMKHGQFLPYDTIAAGDYSTKNPENLYGPLASRKDPSIGILPESDPRKYERLYQVSEGKDPNFHNGMEISAGFVQTPSGMDRWKHDIVFEFTGDDDFWLYVDNELVIDLGGVHSALEGNVNFRTGIVNVNGTTTQAEIRKLYTSIYNTNKTAAEAAGLTLQQYLARLENPKAGVTDPDKNTLTLKEIFVANYLARTPTATYDDIVDHISKYFEKDIDDTPGHVTGTYGYEDIFKDYSAHNMRIFYMERGAGASNLHMRFNLSEVRPGQVAFTKTVEGADNLDFKLVEYPYQIYYQEVENGPFERLSPSDNDTIPVTYVNSSRKVKYTSVYLPVGCSRLTEGSIEQWDGYHDVYFLNPGEEVAINFPDGTIQYYIVECGVNNEVYTKVLFNNAEFEAENVTDSPYPTASTKGRKDYKTKPAKVNERPSAGFSNVVDPEGKRTLKITKILHDENWNKTDDTANILSKEQDSTLFSYRLYLANENFVGELTSENAASLHKYRVLDPDGNYCKWNAEIQGFQSLDKNDYTTLTDTEKIQATFETSPNGIISKIPSKYVVEVPELLVGTRFMVLERTDEIPKGYDLVKYVADAGSFISDINDVKKGISGTVRASESPSVYVHNKRGYGLTANKIWTDSSYVGWHLPIYVAVYVKEKDSANHYTGSEVLLDSLPEARAANIKTVKAITKNSTSAYFYFDNIVDEGVGYSFEDYVVREVELTNPVMDTENTTMVASYDSINKIASNELVEVKVRQVNPADTNEYDYSYAVTYGQGTVSGSAGTEHMDNVRTDTVKNTRSGGIQINLGEYRFTDANNNITVPLEHGKFKLTLYRRNVGEEDYVVQAEYDLETDSDGLITTLYNFMRKTNTLDAYYELEEIQSPSGYVGLPDKVKFEITRDTQGVDHVAILSDNNGDSKELNEIHDSDNVLIANINVFNKPFNFNAVKFDKSDASNKLGDVIFALYRQVTGGSGAGVKDYRPIEGYESLKTNENGIIEKINNTLPVGKYYLTEVKALTGFEKLIGDILFEITRLGDVELIDAPEGVVLNKSLEDGTRALDLEIPNQRAAATLTVTKTVTGNLGDREKLFTFTLKVAGVNYSGTYTLKRGGTTTVVTTSDGTFTLANGDSAEFELPPGQVTVTEANEDYKTTFKLGDGTGEEVNTKTFNLSGNMTLAVTNTRNSILPMGAVQSVKITAFVGIAMLIGIFILLMRKRRYI